MLQSLCRWLPAFRIRPPGFHQQKKLKNFPWVLKCRMLSVQGVCTSHPVLETEASASQAWPEGQDRTGCKQRLPQSKGSFLLWGSSRTGAHGFGGRDTFSCLNLSSYFPSSYYIDGRVAKVTDFLKTRLLDTLSDQIRKIQKVSECKGSAGARGHHACSAWLWHSSWPALSINPGELVWGREGEGLFPVLPVKMQPALIQGMGGNTRQHKAWPQGGRCRGF